MTQSADDITWARVFATVSDPNEPFERKEVYARMEEIMRREAKTPEKAWDTLSLASDVLAALFLRRDRAAAEDFLQALMPVFVERAGFFEMFPDRLETIALTSLQMTAATFGHTLTFDETEVNQLLGDYLIHEPTPLKLVTVELISLLRGRFDHMNAVPKMTPAKAVAAVERDPMAMLRVLHHAMETRDGTLAKESFARYLQGFPAMLWNETSAWRHLLLAGRIALNELGDVPLDQVAERVRQSVRALAGLTP